MKVAIKLQVRLIAVLILTVAVAVS